ncbi:hypothetical protein AAFF_G00260750 [Aldrovandia affinis]|uniref:Ig-like domain-containing protein n=1 Tax=Aldrovandia affinis TaxID=143900 RepID=A0AAD7RCI1_9TELE|nr:hypothetical protein AAFF_G00260750 [Aldrovandia affinis]
MKRKHAGALICMLTALAVSLSAASAGDFSVSVPSAPVSVWLGDSVTLPCSVTPPMDVSPLEVGWYRPPHHHAPFLLYKDRRIDINLHEPQYWGRVFLVGLGSGVGGLEGGNASLSLRNVTVADSGEYGCYVNSGRWCGRTAGECFLCVGRLVPKPSLTWRNREGRELKDQQGLFYSTDPQGLVTVSGWLLFSPSDSGWLSCTVSLSGGDSRESRVAPHTPGAGVGGQQVNVSCVSDGWSPKPSLIWRNREGRELKDQQGLFYSTDPQGLVTVSGWLLFSPSDSEWLSCTVSLSGGDSRESRVALHTPGADESVGWIARFITLLVLSVSAISVVTVLFIRSRKTSALICVLTALAIPLSAASAGDFSVSVPSAPVSVWLGDSVTLPCSVTPAMDVSPLEVRWYRSPHHNAPFLLYKDRRIEPSSQENKYQGRVFLVGLGSGELGSIPVLFVHQGVGGQQVNVSCVSDGWSPKPSLIWRNREGRELKDQQGLFYSTGESVGCIARFITLLVLSVSAISVVTVLFIRSRKTRDFSVSVPSAPVSVWLGDSVTLPCSVTPPMDVSPLEVRWYRPPHHHAPFLLYKDRKIEPSSQDNKYQGRVFLVGLGSGVGGLEGGNVSLSLRNVTMADSGAYKCYVGSLQWYDVGRISLQVNSVGGQQVNVSCVSDGWSPKPSLIWRNREGRELKDQQGLFYSTDPQGLVTVSGWLLFSPSDSGWLSCTVSLSGGDSREGRVAHTHLEQVSLNRADLPAILAKQSLSGPPVRHCAGFPCLCPGPPPQSPPP